MANLHIRKWRFGIYFLIKIVVFAVFYRIAFSVAEDSFKFVDGYNSAPITAYNSTFYFTDDPSAMSQGGVDTTFDDFEDATKRLAELYERMKLTEQLAEKADRDHQSVVRQLNAAIRRAEEQFREENISPIRAKVASLESEMLGLEKGSDRAVEISEEILASYTKISRLFDSMSIDRLAFAPDDLAKAERTLSEAADRAYIEKSKAQSEFRNHRSVVAQAFSDAKMELSEKVGFWDFLYFSACVSTTTTFGDISPNSAWLKFLVVVQIAAGILILSRAISDINRPQKASIADSDGV